MGNSISNLCPDDLFDGYSGKKEVLLMKEDGELVKVRAGTRVKDVLASYPFHKIVLCCGDRLVLKKSRQLSGKRLYFLLPEGLAVSHATYRSLMRIAVYKELIECPKEIRMRLERQNRQIVGKQKASDDSNHPIDDDDDDLSLYENCKLSRSSIGWPALQSIPEAISSSSSSPQPQAANCRVAAARR